MHHHRLRVMQVLLDAIVGELTQQNKHQIQLNHSIDANENTDRYLIVSFSSFLIAFDTLSGASVC